MPIPPDDENTSEKFQGATGGASSPRSEKSEGRVSASVNRRQQVKTEISPEDVQAIRKFISVRFDDNAAAAEREYGGIVSHDVIGKIIKGQKVNWRTYATMMHLMKLGSDSLAYNTIASRIYDDNNIDRNIERWSGKYVYFRFRQIDSNEKENIEYNHGGGQIEIFADETIHFTHSSANFDGDKPEHKGYCFANSNNLYLLGMSKGVLRLSMAMNVSHPHKELIRGIVLSQMITERQRPFSARFLMMHESIVESHSELFSKDPSRATNGRISTIGAEKFKEYMNKYVFFMLAKYESNQ